MRLEKITPTHQAMATIKETIKTLELQYAALAATLPEKTPEKAPQTFTHPLTGKIYKIGRQ